MENQSVLYNIEDRVALVTLNRPDAMNSLNDSLKDGLMEIMPKLDADESVGAIVITGAGKAFCAGGDLHGFKRRYEDYRSREGGKDYFSNAVAMMMLSISKPILAAINGPAVGGGLTLSLTCDIRLASDRAKFGASFVKVGLTPEYGSSFLLPRLVGYGKAFELVLTGKIIDAHEAERIGLINRLVEHNKLIEETMEMAREIANLPPLAIRLAKKALRHGMESTLAQAIDYETHIETYCFTTRDHYEAVTAFLEKRNPTFQGR
jgi:enoyl-CoA hydratase/carnithine racemase